MPVIKYIFLGIIQGLTEFFPVSSSGHLVIFQELLKVKENQILLDIVLHLGTLLALAVFLFKDIKSLLNKKIIVYLIAATAVTAGIVLLTEKVLGSGFWDDLFVSAKSLAIPFLLSGLILLATRKYLPGRRALADLKISDALWFGLAQGLAVIPGLSRMGLTVSVLLFRRVEQKAALQFSLLASVLAISGAAFLKLKDLSGLNPAEFRYISWGFAAAFFSGLLALKILLLAIRRAKWPLFGYYCLALALILSAFAL